MTKRELVSACAEKTHDYKRTAEKYVDAILDAIEDALVAGDSVKLVGFGKFEVVERKARIGRNPKRPQETHEVAAQKGVKFTAGKGLKDAVNR